MDSPPPHFDPRECAALLALKKERQKQGLSAAQLSKNIGISRNTITSLERWESRPTLWVLLKIADGLGVNLKDFLD